MTTTAPPRRPPGSTEPGVPRPPRFSEPNGHEALIEEARKRARRRRRGYGACALLGAAAVAFLGFHNANGHGRVVPPSEGKVSRSAASPSAWRSGQLAIGDIDGTTVVNGDGTNLHVLSAPRSQVTFSPDGRQLTYLDRGGWIVDLAAATGQVRTIVHLGRAQWAYPRWSPNGRSLAYAFGTIPGPTSIATINPDGHQPPPRRGQERKLVFPLVSHRTVDRLYRPQLHQDLAGATRRKRQTPRHLSGEFRWLRTARLLVVARRYPDCLHRAITARPDRRCAAHRRHRTPFHQRRPPPGRRPVVTKRTVTRVRSQWHPDRPPTRQRRRDPRRTRSVRRAVVTRRTLDRVPNHQEGQHRHRPGNRRGGLARRNPAPPDRDAAQTRNPRLGIIPNPVAG